jgi:hypothetical protein
LGLLVPLSCFEHPVGFLPCDPPSALQADTTVTPLTVNSVKTTSIPSDNDFKEFTQYFDFSKSCLSAEQVQKLLLLLYDYKDLFVKKGETLRVTNVMEMDIKLKPDTVPLKVKPYRTTPDMRQEINKQIQEKLRADVIELSDGVYTSPVFLVPKKDSTFCMVVDYRKLNQQTIPENFPMQNIIDSLHALGSSHPTIFLRLTCKVGIIKFLSKNMQENTRVS